jgi:hypothetical protein
MRQFIGRIISRKPNAFRFAPTRVELRGLAAVNPSSHSVEATPLPNRDLPYLPKQLS